MDITDVFYFNAYQELSTCRPHDTGRVPWTAVLAYGEFYGMPAGEIEDLFTVVSRLDQSIKDEAAAKDKPPAAAKPKKKGLSRGA